MNKEMQVFIGSLLGDGNLFLKDGKYVSYNEMHSLNQKDYLLWKMRLMSKILNFAGSPYIFNKYDKRTKKEYSTIKINSSDSKKLKKYYNFFYKKGIKIVPRELLYKLDGLGLAIWYQDDGTYYYGSYRCSIATDNFDYNEHILIKKFLKDKFDLKCEIYKKAEKFYISFTRKNTDIFLRIVEPYIHKSLVYKLGHLGLSNEDKIVRAKKNVSKNKKSYYIKNREKIINYQREYKKNNPEKIKKQLKDYYNRNKENVKKQHKDYYNKNKELILKKSREYQKKNRDKINKRKRIKRNESK